MLERSYTQQGATLSAEAEQMWILSFFFFNTVHIQPNISPARAFTSFIGQVPVESTQHLLDKLPVSVVAKWICDQKKCGYLVGFSKFLLNVFWGWVLGPFTIWNNTLNTFRMPSELATFSSRLGETLTAALYSAFWVWSLWVIFTGSSYGNILTRSTEPFFEIFDIFWVFCDLGTLTGELEDLPSGNNPLKQPWDMQPVLPFFLSSFLWKALQYICGGTHAV